MSEQAKQCPRCLGPMEIRIGQLGAFWGCIRFPHCKGTITAKGTYMRALTPTKKKNLAELMDKNPEMDAGELVKVYNETHDHKINLGFAKKAIADRIKIAQGRTNDTQ